MSHLLRGFVEGDSFDGGFEDHMLAGLEREGQGGSRTSEEECDHLWIDVGGEG